MEQRYNHSYHNYQNNDDDDQKKHNNNVNNLKNSNNNVKINKKVSNFTTTPIPRNGFRG